MKNEYEIRGDITAIFIKSRKHGKLEALISTNKLDRAKEYNGSWSVSWDNGTQSFRVQGNAERTLIHRWITRAPSGMVVDHINHDTLDNTDSNLRIITNAENGQNRKGAQTNSKSGIRGVMWNKAKKKWHVQIRVDNKTIHIGYYQDIEEATKSAVEARKKHMPYTIEYSA